jgi:hypothetical protein
MVDHAARMLLLVEQVIAVKSDLDQLEHSPAAVRARPPASFERLVRTRGAFDARALAMPRDYERVLRMHDGIDHLWRTAQGSLSLFGHDELIAGRAVPAAMEARAGIVVAASPAGDAATLVPGPTELPALVVSDPRGRVLARFPSVTTWFEWILRTTIEVRAARADGRRRWPAASITPFE